MDLDIITTSAAKEDEKEKAKIKFFELVDDRKYAKAFNYFNNLNNDKKTYMTQDKMGEARLKEIRFNRHRV